MESLRNRDSTNANPIGARKNIMVSLIPTVLDMIDPIGAANKNASNLKVYNLPMNAEASFSLPVASKESYNNALSAPLIRLAANPQKISPKINIENFGMATKKKTAINVRINAKISENFLEM